jgi:hypothetical protein
MEDILWPILDRYTSTDGQDIFEEVMQLLTFLTYFSPALSPRMWTLYPRLLQVGAWGSGRAWGRGEWLSGGGRTVCGTGAAGGGISQRRRFVICWGVTWMGWATGNCRWSHRVAGQPSPWQIPLPPTCALALAHARRARAPPTPNPPPRAPTHTRTHPPPSPQAVSEWAIDYFEEVLLPLDNYIRWGRCALRLSKQHPQGVRRQPPPAPAGPSWLQKPPCLRCLPFAAPLPCQPTCAHLLAPAQQPPPPPPPSPPCSKGTEVFLSGGGGGAAPYLAATNSMLERVLGQEGLPEDQVVCAPRLIGVILQHCRGRVDHCVGEARHRLPSARHGGACSTATCTSLRPALPAAPAQLGTPLGPCGGPGMQCLTLPPWTPSSPVFRLGFALDSQHEPRDTC